ncbi:MAG: radical SAM protein, partial [Chloroflexota bacterium]
MAEERARQALLFEPTGDKLRCLTCERRCLLGEGETGFCGTRRNSGGRLYTLVYGDISSMSVNPIEKKPLFHFHPGSKALTIGSWSCTFSCPWCQNYDISKSPGNVGCGQFMSAARFVNLVAQQGCQGTSISFNEPTLLLEYSLDVFRLAKEAGYYNTYITNGYMTETALDLLVEHGLDALNIDIKGPPEAVRRYCGA